MPPLDAGRGPLVHCRLAALGPGCWALGIVLPALCGDAAGLRNLVREIAAGYGALVTGAELDGEPLQYADLAEWQNGLLEDGGIERWRRRDHAAPPGLPMARAAGPGRLTPRGLRVSLGDGEAIEALARRHGASARAFLLACWQILLSRLGDQKEMLLGVFDDGRSYEGLDRALGPFAKHLPLVYRPEPDTSFADLLRRTETELAELRQWQEYYDPEQGSPPEGGEPAYLPACFVFEEEIRPLAAGGVTFAASRVEAWVDRFDLALVGRRCESLLAELWYDERVFRRQDVARLAGQLSALVDGALAAPGTAVADLPALSPPERHRLIVELNQTAAGGPPAHGAHELFERQARLTAGRPAVRCEDREITYGELSGRANRLAHHLRHLGVRPEVPVVICCERSLETVVAILGVLKAGGAYVPLDPGQPAARLGALLEEAGAPVLMTQERLKGALPAHGARVLCLDSDWPEIARESDCDPISLGEPESLAYVIFTSGSTGRPKGVGVEHRQLVNYIARAVAALDLPGEASFATVSTFAADLGHTMIFPSLCLGGCLHVVAQERLAAPEDAADYFSRHPVDCLKIVPTHLEALLGAVIPKGCCRASGWCSAARPAAGAWSSGSAALAPECVRVQSLRPDRDHGRSAHPSYHRRSRGEGLARIGPRRSLPWAARSGTPGSMSWTPVCARCRSACRASSTSAAPASRAATSAGRS